MTIRNIEAIGLILSVISLIYIMFKPFLKKRIKDSKAIKEIQNIMKDKQVTFEEGKDIYYKKMIETTFNLELDQCIIHQLSIKKGYFISLQDETGKLLRGEIIGFKKAKAEGYSYLYGLKKQDGIIVFKPIETIVEGTINIIREQ